jgi:hypothetical protein
MYVGHTFNIYTSMCITMIFLDEFAYVDMQLCGMEEITLKSRWLERDEPIKLGEILYCTGRRLV